MFKLELGQRPLAEHLITEEIPFVVINMLFQRGEGNVWVDSLSAPTTVIAAFDRDCYCAGDLLSIEAQAVLREIGGSTPATPGLREALQKAWGSFAVIPSIEHEYNTPEKSQDFSVPAEYRLEQMAPINIAQVMEFWRDEYTRGVIGDFRDTEDFLQNGFGACIIHEKSGTCVSACAAISVSRERCDYGLDTHPAHEGKGLATACSALAVKLALSKGKRPVWITDLDNSASQRVAQKIGFVKKRDFEIFKRVHIVSRSL